MMKNFIRVFLLLTFLSTASQISVAQSDNPADYKDQTDLKDILKDLFNSKSKLSDTLVGINVSEKTSISILPGVSYNPATSFLVGLSASISWYNGDRKTTTNSNISSGASYTAKGQFKLSLQTSIFSKNNDYSLQGDLRLWNYSQETYGLGTGTLPSAAENMEFKLIRFNQTFLKKFLKGFYAGLGYSLETYYAITTEDLDDNYIYPNINNTYSVRYGYDTTKYLSSGAIVNLNYDTRDNTVNAYRGVMVDAKYYFYQKFLGSDQNFQRFDWEIRAFHSLNKKKTYRLALWLLGNSIVQGDAPYMSLPSNGWDKTNSMARGYIQGRFRGRNLLYGEIENRIDLTSNGLLGLAIFANAITISNPDDGVKIFDYIEPAGGVGLRVKFDKYSRTNISVDYAIGKHGSSGVFLTIGEFF